MPPAVAASAPTSPLFVGLRLVGQQVGAHRWSLCQDPVGAGSLSSTPARCLRISAMGQYVAPLP